MIHRYAILLTAVCLTSGQASRFSLYGQGNVPSSAQSQDERDLLFAERLAKAEKGDSSAQYFVAGAFMSGLYPTKKDTQAGLVWMEKAALNGSKSAQAFLASWFVNNNPNHDTSITADMVKWMSISSGRHYESKNISEATLSEGHMRADLIWESHPELRLKRAGKGMGSGAQVDRTADSAESTPRLKFYNLSQFNEHRRKVLGAYQKSQLPIYNKGESASEEEKSAFLAAVKDLYQLWYYTKSHPVRYDVIKTDGSTSARGNPMNQINLEKVKAAYSKMDFAKIKTELPASREELNEASKYVAGLADLMSLPVKM